MAQASKYCNDGRTTVKLKDTAGIPCEKLLKAENPITIVQKLFRDLVSEGNEDEAFDVLMACSYISEKEKVSVCERCLPSFQ